MLRNSLMSLSVLAAVCCVSPAFAATNLTNDSIDVSRFVTGVGSTDLGTYSAPTQFLDSNTGLTIEIGDNFITLANLGTDTLTLQDGASSNFLAYDFHITSGTAQFVGSTTSTSGVTFNSGYHAGSLLNNDLFANVNATTFAPGATDTFSFALPSSTPSVPEPATWAMMVGGFGLAGGAIRRRRDAKVSFAI